MPDFLERHYKQQEQASRKLQEEVLRERRELEEWISSCRSQRAEKDSQTGKSLEAALVAELEGEAPTSLLRAIQKKVWGGRGEIDSWKTLTLRVTMRPTQQRMERSDQTQLAYGSPTHSGYTN